MASLGEELRAARESRRLSIPDVSEQIHIRSVYLQAIEEEQWSSTVAPVYIRGFIRTYARFLGLDAEDAVSRFNEQVTEIKPEPRPEPPPIPRRRAAVPPWLWAASVAAVSAIVFVGYNYYHLQKATQAAIVAEASPSAPPQAAPAEPVRQPAQTREVAATGTGLSVKLAERSWLRVVVDGRERMEGVFEPGDHREFQGKTATVRAGNAGGVEIAVNGKDMGPLGQQGDVVERTFALAGQ